MKDKRKIPVGYFKTTPEMRGLVQTVLDTGRISYGPLCQQLERKFANIHESTYAVVSASGTDSLRAALHAMKIVYNWPDGSEIIVPATTFVATANVVAQVGLMPVFVDVEDTHYCIDPYLVQEKVTKKTRAIFAVNLLGQPADLGPLDDIALLNNIHLIEDSAEAMFVKYDDVPVGSWGTVAGFSFYMAHLITAGVGGVATTNSSNLAKIMRSLLNHGRMPRYTSIDDDDDILDSVVLKAIVESRFSFLYSGYSSRMTELQAALAMPQLDSYEEMLASRRAVASQLTAGLSKHADRLQLPAERQAGQHAYMMYAVRLRNGIDKMPLIMHLESNGIETRDLLPLINQPIFNQWFTGDQSREFPVSADLINTAFYIGCHQGMTEDDVAYVIDIFDEFLGK